MKVLPGLLVLFLLLSSFSGDTKVFKNTKDWLPEDFDARNNILLIKNYSTGLSGDADLKSAEDKVTDDMKAEMQRLYPYKYEFVSGNQVSANTKYANTDVYRYVIMENTGSVGIDHNMPGPGPNPNNPQAYRAGQNTGGKQFGRALHDFHIYDRKLDKSYSPTGHPNSLVVEVFSPMINTMAQYLKGLVSPVPSQPSASPH
jgi:hypothetical protein